MINNNCAESQTRYCKAYIADCYGRLASSLNTCRSAEQEILKNNILDMLDRIKTLIGYVSPEIENKTPKSEVIENEIPDDENYSVIETD